MEIQNYMPPHTRINRWCQGTGSSFSLALRDYGKCPKISNTLKFRTPNIFAQNNFWKCPKILNSSSYAKREFLKFWTQLSSRIKLLQNLIALSSVITNFLYINGMGTYFNFIQSQEILTENSQERERERERRDFHHNVTHFHTSWMSMWINRVKLCAGNLEQLLHHGRHDKYSSWKTKARINLWSAL